MEIGGSKIVVVDSKAPKGPDGGSKPARLVGPKGPVSFEVVSLYSDDNDDCVLF